MSEEFWQKWSNRLGMLTIGAIFGLVAYMAGVEIKDLDLWLHLAVGKYITVHKMVPEVDFLSATITGHHWVNHEWLFQVLAYNIFDRWGPDGLIKMQMIVVTFTMVLLLLLGYTREKQLTVTFLLFLVLLIFQQRFTIRPDIFSLLFFTLYIFVMSLHIDKRWAPYALFVVQVLWSNFHGYFFFGPVFVLIGLFSELIKRKVKLPYEWNESGRLTDSEFKRLWWIFVWVVVACFFNPGTINGALYPIGVFFSLSGENKIFFEFIQELQKPIKSSTLFDTSKFIYYKLIIVLSFVSFVFNRRRIDISALFFWLVFLIFSMKAARNTSYFAFAAYLVCITNLLNISYADIVPIKFTIRKFQHLTLAVAKLMFLLWLFSFGQGIAGRAYYDFHKYEHKSEFGGISLRNFPNKAVDFLVENKVKGNFFNDFNSGAYLIGRCFPDIKVYIDGRTEVYGGEYFKNYQKIWEHGDPDAFEEAVEQYNLTGALLNSVRQHIPPKIIQYLYKHEDWDVVYFDFDGVIFLRNNVEANKHLIEKYRIDLAQWEPKKLDLMKLGTVNVKPMYNHYRAYTLESIHLDDQALAEALEAIKVRPDYPDAHQLIGKIYAKRKDFQKAFEHFRLASLYNPFSKEKRYNLALSFYDLGEYEHAIEQYDKIIAQWPNDAKAYFHLARTYAKNKQYDLTMEKLQLAIQQRPDNVHDIIKIGDIIFEQKEYNLAKDVYAVAFNTGKEKAVLHKKLGLVYQELEQFSQAVQHFEKAIELNPDDEEFVGEIKKLISE